MGEGSNPYDWCPYRKSILKIHICTKRGEKCEDRKRQPFTRQGKRPPKKPTLAIFESQTSSSGGDENVNFPMLPVALCYGCPSTN